MRVSQMNIGSDQRLLWTMKFKEQQLKKNPGNTVRDNAKASLTTISCHLKLIGKIKKMDKQIPHELNENHKCKRFEISSALLLRNT